VSGGEEAAQFALEDVLIDHPGMAVDDVAVTVDEQRQGHLVEAVALPQLVIADYYGVLHFLLFDKRLDDLPAVIVHGDADDHQPVFFVRLAEFHVPGDLGFAAVTPGCPEVEEHDFPLIAR